jgi:hypothetical protein
MPAAAAVKLKHPQYAVMIDVRPSLPSPSEGMLLLALAILTQEAIASAEDQYALAFPRSFLLLRRLASPAPT